MAEVEDGGKDLGQGGAGLHESVSRNLEPNQVRDGDADLLPNASAPSTESSAEAGRCFPPNLFEPASKVLNGLVC
jgi:hypothetical protein